MSNGDATMDVLLCWAKEISPINQLPNTLKDKPVRRGNLVISDKIQDSRQEWRDFGISEEAEDRRRTGMPISLARCVRSSWNWKNNNWFQTIHLSATSKRYSWHGMMGMK
jgi:hypothetical protein